MLTTQHYFLQIMTEEYEHRYFDRKSSEWKIEDFLNECDIEEFDHKMGIYIRSLKSIAKSGEGVRKEQAQRLLNRYREASIRAFA